MAEVTRVSTNSLASLLPDPSQKITGLVAGEVLTPGDACYIKASDGRVYKSNGTALTEVGPDPRRQLRVRLGAHSRCPLLRVRSQLRQAGRCCQHR
jgi:hypothetical protein